MHSTRFTTAEAIVAAAGILLLALSAIPMWGSYVLGTTEDLASERVHAWNADAFTFAPRLAVLAAFTASVLVLLRKAGIRLGIPGRPSYVYSGIGVLTTTLLVITLVEGPRVPTDTGLAEGVDLLGLSIEASRGVALYAAVVLGAAIVVGGALRRREEAMQAAATKNAPPAPKTVDDVSREDAG